jgi:hypothetical protein
VTLYICRISNPSKGRPGDATLHIIGYLTNRLDLAKLIENANSLPPAQTTLVSIGTVYPNLQNAFPSTMAFHLTVTGIQIMQCLPRNEL